MLLVHTTGSTRIGEVRRYTITYTPSSDRLLPLPAALHLRIKNTAPLPFRAAYLHGPYTLYVSVRRQEFEPWTSSTPGTRERDEELQGERDRGQGKQEGGIPVYDPHLKAGASFYATLPIPPELIEDSMRIFRESGAPDAPGCRKGYEHGGRMSLDGKRTFSRDPKRRRSVTWIIEVISQVIFSTTATVGYEILLGRDEKCLSFAYPLGSGNTTPRPGSSGSDGTGAENGVLSRAVQVKLQGTKELWETPAFPSWQEGLTREEMARDPEEQDEARERRRKQKVKRKTKDVHLVILTHGLHSNTGADMLFLKESIDEEERKATLMRRKLVEEGKMSAAEEENAEQVIVRGFHDNSCRTERGIKYLGKRLARFVLHTARPNHPPLPQSGRNKLHKPRKPHHHPHLTPEARDNGLPGLNDGAGDVPPYKITSISFIGHSLGGLVQTYAIAYIHAHSPTFFQEIKPVNFVALATPFLGLSNENPLYVRFALDFGLVGKTGQDLGLKWRAPGAFAAFGGNGTASKSAGGDGSSKPLLRILPTGPAHEVLKMFRNRTVYANVVNDGIVPLRTSCLLFLDWKGLGRVDKARRENGPVGGLVEWGWGQLVSTSTATSASKPLPPTGFGFPGGFGNTFWSKSGDSATSSTVVPPTIVAHGTAEEPAAQRLIENNPVTEAPLTNEPSARERSQQQQLTISAPPSQPSSPSIKPTPNPFSAFMTLLRPHAGTKSKPAGKIYHRSQTHSTVSSAESSSADLALSSPSDEPTTLEAPPKTSILEAAGDVLNPPLPSTEFLIDPGSRPQTIFHDRVYHADEIPPLPASKRSTGLANISTAASNIPVEEKIARAYHKGMSWRKVLVRLEPDAHNNMVVRRMFANAYGWPVIQHLVETHFGMSYEAVTPDAFEGRQERADTPEGLTEATSPTVAKAPPDTPTRRRSDTVDTASWTSDAFNISDDDVSTTDSEEDANAEETLQAFLGLPPTPQKQQLERGTTEVSKVSAEAAAAGGVGTGGTVGLGLRNLSFGSGPGGGWGERRRSGESERRSEAVKMLERCSSTTTVRQAQKTSIGSSGGSPASGSGGEVWREGEREGLLEGEHEEREERGEERGTKSNDTVRQVRRISAVGGPASGNGTHVEAESEGLLAGQEQVEEGLLAGQEQEEEQAEERVQSTVTGTE
ncbi:putative serine esterase-domain-containing protein [Tricharina praecox]|uniref:putative serine esterase-domain-containing protein n=1 Tax=Tricharina praecox TaxID=43433 RepID=UPI00221F78E8|nr:putative serine esterase-domain-containing protein [Tricharina praecox]XP_051335541.1 putative serine esterase-domain-containing protein [Tricharina praecox]KAI5840594.1 putative serine esterase-domain-containing protein [Tricharina praecox]KAI5843598.1 putative serine esterase-domain-containing protein [Tricharina praecox]